MPIIKARQLAIYRAWRVVPASWLDSSSTNRVSIKVYEKHNFIFVLTLICDYVFELSFLTTLDIYKAYFRSRHIREYKDNECKRWLMPYSLKKKLLHLCALGFCNQVLLDLHCWWSEELCSQQSSSSWCVSHILGAVHLWLVTN